MKLNRRHFLVGLASLGAAITLPVPLAHAKPAHINAAWAALLEDPLYFEVNEFDTITTAGEEEPTLRSEVFDADIGDRCTIESLIGDIEACWPLCSHFQWLAARERDEVESQLDDWDDLPLMERRRLKRAAKALDDERQGWAAWMRLEGSKGLPRFKNEVADWMARDIEYGDYEWFPRSAGAQGSALDFFESLPFETLAALGVVIVEGDHPGSTYYAAELRVSVEEANQAADSLGLPIRFR